MSSMRGLALTNVTPKSELTALLAQDLSNGIGGFWRLTYTDRDFRILYTNLGNVFVLVR